jgi:hypothetical protein
VVTKALERCTDENNRMELLHAASELYILQGKYEDAETYAREYYELCKAEKNRCAWANYQVDHGKPDERGKFFDEDALVATSDLATA